MRAGVLAFLAVMVSVSAAGCGGLSEASTQACSEGKASAAHAKGIVDNGPPELMVMVAKSKSPDFQELAAKADDDDVRSALTELSKTFAEFKPDLSKVPTALRSDPEFTRYVNDFKAAVGDRAAKLGTACS
ncbi:MAG: hypothetical protein ABW215_19400 [Kibdelosporangium sp.]